MRRPGKERASLRRQCRRQRSGALCNDQAYAGKLEFLKQREQAQALGAFDVHKFNDAMLLDGAVPADVADAQ